MKLSEIKGEAALELFVEIIDPLTEISKDKEMWVMFKDNATMMELAKHVLTHHKDAALDIIAKLEGVSREELIAGAGIFTIPQKISEMLTDIVLMSAFPSAAENGAANTSGSPSGNAAGEI